MLGIGLNFLLQDPFITSEGIIGNTSFTIQDTSNLNMTILEPTDTPTLKSFPNALKIMFGFRTPIPTAIPQFLASFLSFINWFLFIIFGLAVYRLINPLAAS